MVLLGVLNNQSRVLRLIIPSFKRDLSDWKRHLAVRYRMFMQGE